METIKKFGAITIATAFVFGLFVQTTFAAGPGAINLGTAGNFVILAKTAVTTTGTTSVTGDIGISPAAASYITGFALSLPSAGAYSMSGLVNGKIYAPGYADATPTNLTTAVLNMQTAYTDAMGRAADITELGAGNISGLILAPGTYKWSTGVVVPTDITLSGGANDVWIFQIAQNLDVSSGVKINLSGGAQASNVYWVVAGQTTIGTGAVFNGNILDQTSIVLNTGAVLNGRALAQAAVTLDASTVSMPAYTYVAPTVTVTPVVTTTVITSPLPAPTLISVPATNTVLPQTQTQVTTQTTATSQGAENSALQAQLDGLIVRLQNLQSQASAQGVLASAFGQEVRAIAMNLSQGSRGADVGRLQEFLMAQDKGPAARALSTVGATSYFGGLTRQAVAEFQASVGITPAVGYFGAKSRAYIMANY